MTDIRCEYCGGNNKYDPATSSIRCEHCGRSKQIKINSTPRMFTRKYSLSYSPEQKVVGSRQYMCSTCGATMTFEENDDRQRCPSCGDTSLVSGEKSIYVPDGVVPFAISRERAVRPMSASRRAQHM